ncbi:TldD/PmbA family protein [Roseofilum sp. BLCC_M114]|uniref:TldD/PmbA family protein n=1 Tax=Roseofilum capinflatum BLCC-M114 TaxID=3022440 RepID=A0ABT7B7A6_9CYAN|nr:TldD/PmbA family protein [Roseofilum capinflatum]MDJ1174173.1 TldD/PmbA family protein [Roseofilum capinflatum BLCC-M114]
MNDRTGSQNSTDREDRSSRGDRIAESLLSAGSPPSTGDPSEVSWDNYGEQLLDLAARNGAEAAEVFLSKSHSTPILFEANRLKSVLTHHSEGVALRLWKNGKPGLAVSHGSVAPEQLVEKAIALSALQEKSEYVELTPGRKQVYPDLGTWVEGKQLLAWGEEAIAQLRETQGDILCSAELDSEAESTRLLNSEGLDCSYTDTTLSGYLAVEWVRSDDFCTIGDGQVQRDTLNLGEIVSRIQDHLTACDRNVAAPKGRVPILFTAKAADLLWETLSAALNGKQVFEGSSPWADKRGEQVTSSQLTLYQDPQIGPYSCPFDDEGTPTKSLVFVDKGRVKNFLCDRTTGRQLGTGTTGNGFRPSLGSYPTPSLYNLIIYGGTNRQLKDLIASLPDALIVDQILGSGGGISGDFSINVDLGYRVRNGEIIGRVKDTMVAGNIYHCLRNVVELGGDREWNGSCYTPSVIVEGLSITSKLDN